MKKSLALGVGLFVTGISGLASASFHLMKVSEVMTSADGNTAIQFVEFTDSGEPFPAMAYSLEVFDETGASVGSVPLTRDTLAADQAAYYIGTPAADAKFGKNSDAVLNVQLPMNGTVCYKGGTSLIHCLKYGTVSGGPTASTSMGPAPPDGMSLQRGAGGAYFVGPPTPKAANGAAPAPDAGVPTADAAPGTPDAAPGAPDAAPSAGSPDASMTASPDGGCSVAVGRRSAWVTLALFGLVLVARRRRR